MSGPTLSSRFKALSEQTTMVRGRGAYGRKPNKSLMQKLSEFGPVTTHHYDDATGETTLDTTQDVESILDANVDLYNDGDGWNEDRTMRRVASIPLVYVEKLYKKGIDIFNQDDWPKVAALLDSGEFRKFRTAPGVISRKTRREYVGLRGQGSKLGSGGGLATE